MGPGLRRGDDDLAPALLPHAGQKSARKRNGKMVTGFGA
jgi:hypothetical protein